MRFVSLLRRIPRILKVFNRRCQELIRLNVASIPLICTLAVRNWFTGTPLTQSEGPVVSLTTHGKRIRTVHLTIESIGRGEVLPSRIVLWLDDEAMFRNPPVAIRRLQKRGLEVKLCRNYGPHEKYYPYVASQEVFRLPLVTADDDVLYPRSWLKGLIEAFRVHKDCVNCYRARVIEMDENGLSPYTRWKMCATTEQSFRHFATGVSGVIYPPRFLSALKRAGWGFEKCCPKADDLWLHVQALRAGYEVRQVGQRALHFYMIPGTQGMALARQNFPDGGGNDKQARATYTESDIELLQVEQQPNLDPGPPIPTLNSNAL